MREGGDGSLVFGVRPEHIRLNGDGGYRARVLATEYLGTTQIVTLETANGEVKARVDATQRVGEGETVGLDFQPGTITLFDRASGRAMRSALNEGVLADG